MIDSEIRQQTYQFFLEEAPELLQILETGLLNLKQKLSPALVHDLMRSAHSLKGGAATVGLDALAMIAHRLESILRGLYSDKVELDTELETWLLEAYDCLKEPLQQQINQGSFAEESALVSADLVFSKIETRLGDVLKEAENYIPNSSDLGVDMVSSIFEVDVAQGIERLAMVLENPQKHEVEGELRAQAEVFAGFAEILGLPGFGEI
ncbi:MAG: Hpt domain-containing protein, partial [Waterburya sp.]